MDTTQVINLRTIIRTVMRPFCVMHEDRIIDAIVDALRGRTDLIVEPVRTQSLIDKNTRQQNKIDTLQQELEWLLREKQRLEIARDELLLSPQGVYHG